MEHPRGPCDVEPPPCPAAERYERKAAQAAAERQILMLQVDLLMQQAGHVCEKEQHYLALADLHRASELPPMRTISAALPQVERKVS